VIFLSAGELSGDLYGAKLIEELLKIHPHLKIAAVAGPRMRDFPIETHFRTEDLLVMGFIDVLRSLPKLLKQFFAIRNRILQLNPKAVIFIDYPGLHLRLARSLRKKGYKGKIIHFICPTVWAWGKKRIPLMAKHLDLLLTLFPFEKQCFADTSLPVHYVGHPLIKAIPPNASPRKKIIALFPGSRKTEIERNLPLQLAVARRLQKIDPTLEIALSKTHFPLSIPDVRIFPLEQNYELMRTAHIALATSGTVTLELALHKTPTVVTFAVKPLDCFIVQKILRINLPFYCIVNIIAQKQIFPELFGPNLTEDQLFFWARELLQRPEACLAGCEEVRQLLGEKDAIREAALTLDF
jgi:lipid-A-disaccharide synthase